MNIYLAFKLIWYLDLLFILSLAKGTRYVTENWEYAYRK